MMNGNRFSFEMKYRIVDIIAAIQKNREAAAAEYTKAVEGYFIQVKKMLDDASKKLEKREYLDRAVWMQPPVDTDNRYVELMRAFKLSAEPEVTLNSGDYDVLVNDAADWASTAKMTNSMYSSVSSAQ